MSELVKASRALSRVISELEFSEPVTHVYNPLEYARRPHELYLSRFGSGSKEVVLVGMNPGPFGMAQTGVPFGDVGFVRDWMGIEASVDHPGEEHPKRPVLGFHCERSEVSGSRVWGWARERFGTPERFFSRFFVLNYCPLLFLESTGRNRTPDKLRADERAALLPACDQALRDAVGILSPSLVVGVGVWATRRARAALGDESPAIGSILHPSPASPKANRGWAPQAESDLRDLGVDI
ncbi:MAG: single-stranded DNA-binding protein [Deltaproteobacteria bacterium]|nr:single-stranded DNA-binding protein [Deltaproteobacteria bacterium]NND29229.1 single-stranded DNA-binding protein [Myxococcales bacterium]MBT8465330.1 single-stranded DNA-binding protein [Deltaproteobacteria bacterium]MBT8483359.1 single-stranded DNA-binding protein [Deltaproteobacteria bacterium]NNK05908.1 single-stranded DNA-binding protein [Myxococcales bacterium]